MSPSPPHDWDELYSLAREHLPRVHGRLVEIDYRIADLVRAGADLEHSDMISLFEEHDDIMSALRVIRATQEIMDRHRRARGDRDNADR